MMPVFEVAPTINRRFNRRNRREALPHPIEENTRGMRFAVSFWKRGKPRRQLCGAGLTTAFELKTEGE